MQKMNEYSLQKEKQRHDSLQQGNKNQLGRNRTGTGKKGPYSKDFAKVNYRDDDMKRLATTGKGTTSLYNYQDNMSSMSSMSGTDLRSIDSTKG